MSNDYMREIAELRGKLVVAVLRSKRLSFTYKVPREFIENRTRSAYDSGYEAGWRGWDYSHSYSRACFQQAYRQGYNDAINQLREEVKR